MSPEVSKTLLGDIIVMEIGLDFEIRTKFARELFCYTCGTRYGGMTWQESDTPGEPILVCACGLRFPVASSKEAQSMP